MKTNTDWCKRYEETLEECVICKERIYSSEKAKLKCNHMLHKLCLAKWSGNPKKNVMDRNKGCPLCRGPLELNIQNTSKCSGIGRTQ